MTGRTCVVGVFAALTSVCLQAQAPTQLPGQMPGRLLTKLPASLSAQSPAQGAAPATGAKVSVEGCVERVQRNGSVGGTGVGTSSSPNTADRDANSSEALNVFQLSDANRLPQDSASGGKTTYGLQGHEQEMGGHTGHRVQVTGTLAPAEAQTPASSAASAGIRRIRVDAVKMISGTCDKPAAK